MVEPSHRLVRRIVWRCLSQDIAAIERFPTGLCHYVYGVRLADGGEVVVRIADPGNRRYIEGAVYWHERLRPLGVPLADLIAHDATDDPPWMVVARLPGQDLGLCYGQLSPARRRAVAEEIAAIQSRVHTLPEARGFGYATSYDDPELAKHAAWTDVVRGGLNRARGWLRQGGIDRQDLVDRVAERVESQRNQLDAVRPRAFLDDTTTKNVLIHDGHLAGIVDVDEICFGDPLQTIGLTWMSLLAAGHETDYVMHWADVAGVDDAGREVLRTYAATACITFIGELGMTFNKAVPDPIEPQRLARLEGILDELLA